jgi:hypothetical protein
MLLAAFFMAVPLAQAGDAPAWMHALTSAAVPAHDEKNDAVELYSEDIFSVAPNGKIKNIRRRAFKILRPGGKDYGFVYANFDSETKISGMKAWCIPAQGKDYEVKEKDAAESALPGIADGELMNDVRTKILQIPASDPGNIVGYEIEQGDVDEFSGSEACVSRRQPMAVGGQRCESHQDGRRNAALARSCWADDGLAFSSRQCRPATWL